MYYIRMMFNPIWYGVHAYVNCSIASIDCLNDIELGFYRFRSLFSLRRSELLSKGREYTCLWTWLSVSTARTFRTVKRGQLMD